MLERKIRLVNKLGWALLVAVVSISGCVEEEGEYTINPDGSGKVVYSAAFKPAQLRLNEEEPASKSQVRSEVENLLQKSEGIEVWKDVSYGLTEEGAIHFAGTAYFPDINNLDIRAGGFSKDMKLNFSRDLSGQITIELKRDSNSKNDTKAPVPELSEAELAQKVTQTRLQYQTTKPMMLSMLGTFKSDTLLHLPGEIREISNFTKIDSTTVGVKLEGSRMIEGIDKMMADDEWLKQQIRASRNPLKDRPDDLLLNDVLFGQKAPVRVVLRSGDGNLFDYDTEVAAAKKDYAKMLEELGLGQTSPAEAPAAASAPAEPGTARVGGVRLVRHYDKERGIRPLGYQNDYTLSLILELPEPNLVITEGRVEKAITDTGKDIVPRANPGIPFPKISSDGTAAVFDVQLSVPDEDAKGLAELSGALTYLESTGTKEIDLGVMDFVAGAKSNIEGFSIRSIGVKEYEKQYTRMNLTVRLLRGSVKSARFYREDGTELEVSSAGKSYSQGWLLDIGYKTKGEFPPRGRIVFEVLDNVTKQEIPFRLTNVSLTGEPF